LTRKILAISDPGDGSHWGADDTDYINQYLTAVDQSTLDPVSIATTTKFYNNKLQINNPANTFQYLLVSSAIAANRNITLPLLTGNDQFTFDGFTTTLTNKTYSLTSNTLTDTGIATGDIIKTVSGKFQRYAIGTTGQVLTVSGGDASWQNLPSQTPPVNVLTVAPSGGQYTTLAAAIAALGSNPTIIEIAPGTYSTSSAQLAVLTKSNIWIQGSGVGITNIVADASVTADTPLLDIHGAASGSSFTVTVNTLPGDTTITISAANAVTLNAASAQYILIRSNKNSDTELGSTYHVGEIKKITSINTSTGVITLRDELNDAYLTTDAASLIQIIPANNVSVSGITFSSVAATSARSAGFVFCRFLSNFLMNECEVDHGWWAGVQLSSCINSRIETCYIHDTQDPNAATTNNTHNGLIVHAASTNVVVDTCQFTTLRHSISMGGQTGTNFEGIVRNCTVTNCTSESADTAHFDTHQACENIVFSSNTTIGGLPYTVPSGSNGAYGFQVRSPKTSLVGNKSIRPRGKGIYIFGTGSGTNISGCTVNNALQYNSAGGDAVFLDPNITGINISGCTFQDCAGHAVTGGGSGTNDININGNTFKNCSTTTNDGNILLNGSNVVITGNRFTGGPNRPIQMNGAADVWTISDNDFTGMTTPAPSILGVGSKIVNNTGYNPVGVITTPFPSSTGNLTDVAQTNAAPASAAVITNKLTPKTVIQTGGTISAVTINGTSFSTGTTFLIWKLEIGETFSVTYTVAPTFKVYCA
jgi:hypothetical protein